MALSVGKGEGSGVGWRLRRAQRDQVTPVPLYLDALLPEEHLARLVWAAVEQVDLTAFHAGLKVREDGPGHAAADPQVLVALWLYATLEGVTSARRLARLCVEHLAYIWLCGGVSMNYHSLSDFRVQHEAALDALLTQLLAHLSQAALVEFTPVAQDGVRVRASAGGRSFRREPTLEVALAKATAVLAALKAGGASDDDPPPPSARQQAARERAARERVARVTAALAGMAEARAAKKAGERDKARVSTTDAEARPMKLADAGYRPAYNVQFAATVGSQVVVGVAVTSSGSDMHQAPDMVVQVQQRVSHLAPGADAPPGPAVWLLDGGFVAHESLCQVAAHGVTPVAPARQPKAPTDTPTPPRDPYLPLPDDPPAVAAWRVRMGLAEIQALDRQRAATIECVNAQARSNYGLPQVRVRGRKKVRCIALWIALAHNLRRWFALRQPHVGALAAQVA